MNWSWLCRNTSLRGSAHTGPAPGVYLFGAVFRGCGLLGLGLSAAQGCSTESICDGSDCTGTTVESASTVPASPPVTSTAQPANPSTAPTGNTSTESSAANTSVNARECEDDSDCPESRPACSVRGACVTCIQDTDCLQPGAYCLVAADEDDNVCVQCERDEDCSEGVCTGGLCTACNPVNNRGCDGDLPYCLGSTQAAALARSDAGTLEAPHCVACTQDSHCDVGVCAQSECMRCDPLNNNGCSPGLPYCSADISSAGPSCVACLADNDCGTGVCEHGACTVCRIETGEGCAASTPYCVNAPNGGSEASLSTDGATFSPDAGPLAADAMPAAADAGTQPESQDGTGPESVDTTDRQCVECATSEQCPNDTPFCVDQACEACSPQSNEGCDPTHPVCAHAAPQTANEPVDVETVSSRLACVQCAGDSDCMVGKCKDQLCVECLTNDDCADARAPHCAADNRCTGCSADVDCAHLPGTQACEVTTGACVGCISDEHCAASPEHPVCYEALNICVECTEEKFAQCGSGKCELVPGNSFFQCVDASETSGGTCARCTSEADCDEVADCVDLNDDGELRCIPTTTGLSAASSECTGRPGSVKRADGVYVDICRPADGC